MKKFSNISGSKVGVEPISKINEEEQELLAIKAGIVKLMDRYLNIRSYGSARAELLNNSVSISGKEMFAEALIDFLSDKELKKQIKTLESLKSNNKDWVSIENKMNELYSELDNKNLLIENKNQVSKIITFLETYGNDERFDEILESYTKRINSSKEAYNRSLISIKMINDDNYSNYSDDKLSKISEMFLKRSKELGYNGNY